MADYRINPKTGEVVDIETLPKGGATPVAPSGGSSLLPSGLSTVGGMLGEAAGPGGALAGTVIGSAADKLIDPLSKLMKIGPGPMSSKGVGGAMADAATNVGEGIVGDVAKNTVLNKGIGWLGSGLKAGGAALTKFGTTPETSILGAGKRLLGGGVTDWALHTLGVPTGAAEAISAGTALAAPGIARATGPAMTAAGEALPSSALSGLRAVASKFGADPPVEPFEPATPADSVTATVRGARDNMTAGASRSQASQQAGWPLGKSSEVSMTPEPVTDARGKYGSSFMAEYGMPHEGASSAPPADVVTPPQPPPSLAMLRKSLADLRPIEGDNPVVSRTLNEIRGEQASADPLDSATMDQLNRAQNQAQMLRRLKGGGH